MKRFHINSKPELPSSSLVLCCLFLLQIQAPMIHKENRATIPITIPAIKAIFFLFFEVLFGGLLLTVGLKSDQQQEL